jgi:hypothetical protein
VTTHTDSPKVWVGGHERDAAGAANGSEAQSLLVERERERTALARVRVNEVACKVARMPPRLPGPLSCPNAIADGCPSSIERTDET